MNKKKKMDLQLKNRWFIVGGASDGFGKAVATALMNEGALVIAIARGEEKLMDFINSCQRQAVGIAGDITDAATLAHVVRELGTRKLDGIFLNAGGPPAGSFSELGIDEWDAAYRSQLRWKVEWVQALLPRFLEQQYGRLVFNESVSVKQPLQDLILSNSLRMAVVGMVKTLASEVAGKGITLNVLAPGYHQTAAMERLYRKRAENEGISLGEARARYETESPVGRMGLPAEYADLAAWLLSPRSGFITGQTITIDGGLVKYVFG